MVRCWIKPWILAKVKALQIEANGVLRELGKQAYEKHGESAGAPNMVQPIAQALARLETLDREITALSESHAGGFLTPKRLLVGGGALIALLLLLFVGRIFTGGVATKEIAKDTDLSKPAVPIVDSTVDQSKREVKDASSSARALSDKIANDILSQNRDIQDNLARSKAEAEARIKRKAAEKAAGEQTESRGDGAGNKESAGGGAGSEVRSWDEVAEITYTKPIYKATGSDIALAFSPDGKQLALSGYEDIDRYHNTVTLKVYSAADQQQLFALDLSADRTKSFFRAMGDGKMFASNGTAYVLNYGTRQAPRLADIWDVTNKALVRTLPWDINGQPFISADGKWVASARHEPSSDKDLSDCQVKVWDVTTGKIHKSFPGRLPIAFSPDGKLLAITALPEPQQGKNKIDFVHLGNIVVSLRDLSTGEEVGLIKLESGNPQGFIALDLLVFSPDSQLLALQNRGGKQGHDGITADLWSVSEKKILKRLTGVPLGGWSDLAFSPDGKTLVFTGNPPNGDSTGVVLLIDLPSGKMAGLRYTEGWTQFAAFSPDGTMLAVSTSNGKVKLFQQQAGTKGKLAFVGPRDVGLDRGVKKTPPVTLAVYNQLTEGMTVDEVQQLIGGKAQKSEMNKTTTRDKFGTHWTFHPIHTYDGTGSPGAKVTLFFEQSANTAMRFVLVRKQQQGLQ